MDELVPNPDGCSGFDEHPFKKGKCRNCGRLWNEHKGVIPHEIVARIVRERQKILDDQKKKDEAAREQARAKAVAKKKQTQAVEDEWFFDGSREEDVQEDSDDDMGFQMFMGHEVRTSRFQKPVKADRKPLKVVNLIDFSACDVPDVPEDRMPGFAPLASGPADQAPAPPGRPSLASMEGAMHAGGPLAIPGAARNSLPSAHALFGRVEQNDEVVQELQNEIQHLRQMLADANEERTIQVAIVQDEVLEKQQLADELARQRDQAEAQLRDAREQLSSLEARVAQSTKERDEARALAERGSLEAERSRSEAEQLRAEVERLQVEVAALQVPASEAERSHSQAQQLRTEVERLQAEVAALQAPTQLPAQGGPAPEPAGAPGFTERPAQVLEVSPSALGTILELRELCAQTQAALGCDGSRPEQGGDSAGDFEAELRSLHDAVRAAHAAAERVSSERKHLAEKLRDAEQLQSALLPVSEPMPASPITKHGISKELLRTRGMPPANEDASRHAAQAIKEIRLHAEHQLAMISKRMRTSHQAAPGEMGEASLVGSLRCANSHLRPLRC